MRSGQDQPYLSQAGRAIQASSYAVEHVMNNVKLGWALPNYGPIFSPVYASHLAAIAYASRTMTVERIGDVPMLAATDRMYLHSACNKIVEEARQAGLTHLFWTESDMILPNNTIPKLMALNKPIAAGVYFLRNGGGQPCLYKKTPIETKENPFLHTPITMYDERGPFRVDCPGMGCVLIEMKAFEKIDRPWFDLKANSEGKTDGYGQDLYFYTKVRKAGIEVWVDPSVICDQIDTQVVGYKDYRKRIMENKLNAGGGYIAAEAHTIDGGQKVAQG